MPSLFTSNGGIELPADGEQDGVWGDTVNANMQIIDRLTNGVGAIALSGTTHTLTTLNGALSDGHYSLIVFGGSPSGTNTVTIAPNDAEKVYFVRNTTAESVIITQGSGGDVTIPAGAGAIVYANGAGTGAAVADLTAVFVPDLSNAALTGPATIDVNSTSDALRITQTGSGNALVVEDTTSPDSTPFVITNAGRVGIGTSSPTAHLQVSNTTPTISLYGLGASTAYQITQFSLDAGGFRLQTRDSTNTFVSNDYLIDKDALGATLHKWQIGGLERMRIGATGNVGIGTTNPSEKLDVNGTVKATGLNLNGTVVTATAAELNTLDGVTATTAELNLLDGVTVTLADITATATELNYVDGVTSAIQTQIDTKAANTTASIATSISLTGAASAWAFALSGNDLTISYGGTTKAKLDTSGNLTVTGNVTAYGTI